MRLSGPHSSSQNKILLLCLFVFCFCFVVLLFCFCLFCLLDLFFVFSFKFCFVWGGRLQRQRANVRGGAGRWEGSGCIMWNLQRINKSKKKDVIKQFHFFYLHYRLYIIISLFSIWEQVLWLPEILNKKKWHLRLLQNQLGKYWQNQDLPSFRHFPSQTQFVSSLTQGFYINEILLSMFWPYLIF